MNKRKRTGIIVLISLAVMMIFYFTMRNFFLHKAFERISGKLKQDYQVNVSLDEIRFTGFAGIRMRNFVAVTEQEDTLLIMDSLYVRPALLRLLTGKIKMKEADGKNISLFLVCRDSICNYNSFLRRGKPGSQKGPAGKNYASLLNRMISMAFDFAPQQARFSNINIHYIKDDKEEQILIPFYNASDKHVEGSFVDVKNHSQWNLSGNFSQRRRTLDFKIVPGKEQKANVPLLKSLFAADCKFDTLHCMLSEYHHAGGQVKLSGKVSADNFSIQHSKISAEPAGVRHSDFNFNIRVGRNDFELDSTSSVVLNQIRIHPRLHYENAGSKKYSFQLVIDSCAANDFFNSLPSGMFDELDGVEADGSLRYTLNFFLDSSQPDSLVFNSAMKKEKFRLKKYGKENLLKMNEEFLYSVYEHGRLIRSFIIGPSNPGFTPLDQVSPSFKNAVMTSEDGSFFHHNGFNEDAFRKSIAANYKAGRFVRGGSTITMQLVKNVFLTRHKTISRKVEEALIVWLIESNNLTSKERMFEVYLNIIELGPGIYGIGEASRFYFAKKPAELNLAESVFLASLLPHPKWFKYSFDEQGNLKPYFADYYRVVANFLLKKNLITQDEYDHLQPRIELKGMAKNFVTPVDSLPKLEEEE